MKQAPLPRRVRLAPLGHYTRYVLLAYLRQVVLIVLVLWIIALTIDLWPQMDNITQACHSGTTRCVVRFCLLRTPRLIGPLVPFMTFLGVFVTELMHTRSGERTLFFNSGRSPAQSLMPALLLGLCLGPMDVALDAWLGPASMAVQMKERIGRDGQRLDRARESNLNWIVLRDGLLSTHVVQTGRPVLTQLEFFRFAGPGQLVQVVRAASAEQVGQSNVWHVKTGRKWQSPDGIARLSMSDALTGNAMAPFTDMDLQLSLDPLWLSVIGMEVQYVPFRVLLALSGREAQGYRDAPYRTQLHMIIAEALLPGIMAVLAAALAVTFLAYGARAMIAGAVLFVGYLAHSAIRACALLGESGDVPPILAAWLVPLLAIATVILVLRREKRRR
ncbi:LptF/LptG family permease [Brytella acorum]|uniref:LptF/LptG family permease n=1 Tax=Brytella acorum TaxID=2959299 RepID=A0AA35UX48_9PROT|nr:LptF/LptG family permease [Brytella acorum]MDF3625830.1 LptF/LptG family permease [Brytella acorum]CAI9121258.1 LptF/LptG family permease [Brytella acorum]